LLSIRWAIRLYVHIPLLWLLALKGLVALLKR